MKPISSQNANIRKTFKANNAEVKAAAKEVKSEAAPETAGDSVSLSAPGSVEETAKTQDIPGRRAIPDSFIMIENKSNDLFKSDSLPESVEVEKVLGEAGNFRFTLVNGKPPENIFKSDSGVQFVPNYEYDKEILFDEAIESDVPVAEDGKAPVADHLAIIGVDEAHKVTKGSRDVVSAITDNGLDMIHPRLQGTVWNNTGEIAGDNKDNDNNGYVDDYAGWDVTDNDSIPQTPGASTNHHTHVHGIMHGRELNGDGVHGMAPDSVSIPLRIAGGSRRYSSAVVAEAYLYAMNNGAKTVNTSFNINSFVGDKAMENVYRTLADNDVLVFNSAGNSGEKNPARSVFEDVVLVASTETASGTPDKRSRFSNYGQGIDIAAPGSDILSTVPDGKLARLSGTSMASPNAAGLDVLIQSAHPDWSRSQRYAQMVGTADNISQQNPTHDGELGGGRINAHRAVTEQIAPPRISLNPGKNTYGGTNDITVRFDSVLEPSTANAKEAWSIYNDEGELVHSGASKEVRLLTNEMKFDVSGFEPGAYSFVANADFLADPFGQPLDGNGDGEGGDDFVMPFYVAEKPAPPVASDPATPPAAKDPVADPKTPVAS